MSRTISDAYKEWSEVLDERGRRWVATDGEIAWACAPYDRIYVLDHRLKKAEALANHIQSLFNELTDTEAIEEDNDDGR